MKRTLFIISIIIQVVSLFGQDIAPIGGEGKVIHHTNFKLSYNETHEQANWVYYQLTANMLMGTAKRSDNFRPDAKIKTESASLKDYADSGYDRGHLCPAGDMTVSNSAMSESFYMSNMSPQFPSFNRGIWKRLESTVRNWAQQEENLHIVTGPVFKDNKGTIGPNKVTIPGYYYKVIYDPTGANKMIAFILPNEKGSKPLNEYALSVDQVEALTGIDFFPDLQDEIENRLEANSNPEHWDFTSYSRDPASSGSKNHAKANHATTQCQGTVKSTGNRCKNKTRNPNGFCYAHQSQAH